MKNPKQKFHKAVINPAFSRPVSEPVITALLTFLYFLVPLIFFTDMTRNPYYIQGVILNVVVSAISCHYIYRWLSSGRVTIYRSQIDYALYSYFVICLISWAIAFLMEKRYWHILLPETVRSFYDDKKIWTALFSEGARNNLFLLTNAVLVFIITLLYTRDRKRAEYIITVCLLSASVSSLYGIMQYFGIEIFWPSGMKPFGYRPVSTFGNPNFFSSYLVLVIPLAVYRLIFEKDSVQKIVYSFLSILLFVALVATQTRSSWVGMAAGLFTIFLLFYLTELREKLKHITKFLVPVFIAGLTLAWFSPGKEVAVERFKSIFDPSKRGIAGTQRMLIWKSSLDMFMHRPLLGVGYGLFELYYPFYQSRYLTPENSNLRTHANNSHNEFLEQFNQVGLIGSGAYFFLFAAIFYFAYRKIRETSDMRDKAMLIALSGSITGMLVDNLVNVSIHFAMPAMVFWWIIGLLILYGNNFTLAKTEIEISGTLKKALIGIPFFIFFFIIAYKQVSFFFAEKHYFDGFKLVKRNQLVEKAIEHFLSSYNLHTYEVNNNYELGNSYARIKNVDRAVWAYSEAIAANPGYDEIYYNRGVMYLNRGDTENSVRDLRMSHHINPVSPEVLRSLANIAIQHSQWTEDGIFALKKIVELAPLDKDSFVNLGYLYLREGLWAEAEKASRAALSIDPLFEPARRNLENAKNRKTGDLPAQRTVDLSVYFTEGERLVGRKEWAQAEKTYLEIIRYMPQNVKALLYLGNISFELKKFGEAEKYFGEVLKIAPDHTGAMTNLGITYYNSGRTEAAVGIMKKVLAKEPDNPIARNILDSK